MAWLVDP